jgi:DNA-binding CsgD family transcriptional regulator
MLLASLRGDQAGAAPLIEATIAEATAGGQGNRGDLRALGSLDPRQRPRPFRRRTGGVPAGQPEFPGALRGHVGATRADRGRRPHRKHAHRRRRARTAGGNDSGRRYDFGLGLEAFAERARRELLAAGDTVRRRTVQTASELTDQEAHIAWLAVDGRTNVEIGSQLFLSTRAVEWHLAKVYSKLGVGSRRELRPALAHLQRGDPPA